MKKFRSVIATLLAFCIVLSMFAAVSFVSAADSVEVWDGTTATEYAGGSGTSADPYLIKTPQQLYKAINEYGLKSNVAAYYLIINDLYLNEDYEDYANWGTNAPKNNWLPSENEFKGHINGGYNTIYGLYIKRSKWFTGLIPNLSGSASVSNLVVANSYVNAHTSANDASAGTIVGIARSEGSKIKNCMVHDSAVVADTYSAGIVGVLEKKATIENCGSYNLTLTGGTGAGGLTGKLNSWGNVVKNSYSIGYKAFAHTRSDLFTPTNVSTDNGDLVRDGVNIYEIDKLKGEGAVATMGLSTSVWKDTNGYPTFVGNGTKGEVWSGATAAWYAGGEGTSAHPYLIETAEQLYKAIASLGKKGDGTAAYFQIIADIYLNKDYVNYADWAETAPANNWLPSLNSTNQFIGHLNGGFHTIYGLYSVRSSWLNGFIPSMGSGATVYNLTLANAYVTTGDSDVGAVVGVMYDKTKVDSCLVRDAIISAKNKDVGGIAGGAGKNTTTIINCGVYNVTITGAENAGGILGRAWQATSGANGTRVQYSFSADYNAFGTTGNLWAENVYAPATQSKGGVSAVSKENMQGENALTNMPKLSTTLWKVTDTYPAFAMYNGTEGETWTGAKANGYIGGTGTEEDPYLIATAEQLYKAVSDLGKKSDGTAAYYLVVADIYLNKDYENYADWGTTAPANNWKPTAGDFIGHLDGGFNTVYGMYSVTGAWRNGLIPRTNNGATVKNVTVANAYVHNNDSVAGGIVGGMYSNTKIERCMVYDSSISATKQDVGGIVGIAGENTTTVSNCAVYGLTLGGSNAGGILGRAYKQTSGANGTRVYSCYSIDSYPYGANGNIWSDYNYSNVEGTKGGVVLVDKTEILGANAESKMKNLDFITVWQTNENAYPTLREVSDISLNNEITGSYAVTEDGKDAVKFTSKIVMPTLNPTYDDNIVVTVAGEEKTISEVGFIITRTGVDVTDIATVQNTPTTGYKIAGYTNGGENAEIVKLGGYITISAIVSGSADYIAKSYVVFDDDTVVMTDAYSEAPSTEETTVEGIKINDSYMSGDANFDGKVNIIDLVRMKKYAAEDFTLKNVILDIIDTNGDDGFDATDLAGLRKTIINTVEKKKFPEMKLVFEDNFNTATLDTTKWDFTDYMKGYGVTTVATSDVQSISSDEDGNGYLHLTAYKDANGNYKSTKSISTGNKLTFVHGYVEIRAKVPTVKGAWPSFWLKSNTGNTNLGWSSDFPYNTEVDVLEVMGGNKAKSDLHKWLYDAETKTTTDIRYTKYFERETYTINDDDWHTYGMLWTEDAITMYVDGVEIHTYDLNKDYEEKWFFQKGEGMDGFKNQPLCITLNNHLFTPEYVGTEAGAWASNYVAGDDFTESVYDIDYVRLYQDDSCTLYTAD